MHMIGIWSKYIKRTHTKRRTEFEDDMQSDHLGVEYDKQKVQLLTHTTCLLDNSTYAPIGRIALYADILNLRVTKRLLDWHLHIATKLGWCVDCFYFETAQENRRLER